MHSSRLLAILFLLTFPTALAAKQPIIFDFAKSTQGWGIWGEGSGKYSANIGHDAAGSITLECGSGNEMTLHKEFKKLAKGRYKVTAWIRGWNILPGKWNDAIWLFYKTGEEIQTVKKGFHGTFEWSKIEYTVDVDAAPLNLWFRLRSAGQIWIDDIHITQWDGKKIPFRFKKSKQKFPTPNPIGKGNRCASCYHWFNNTVPFCPICGESLKSKKEQQTQSTQPSQKRLADFEQGDVKKFIAIQKYNKIQKTSGKRSGIFSSGEYINFHLTNTPLTDWQGYHYLGIDVYNPSEQNVSFALAIKDDKSTGYWKQLNHYSTLIPGWNRMRFPIKQFVGERGSVQVQRYLNLSQIQSFWFATSLNKKVVRNDFLVDNIRLMKGPKLPKVFEGLYLFDFVKEPFRVMDNFTAIQSKHRYDKSVGFGFIDAKIWRDQDSQYADTLYRDGIFIFEGKFRIDVPNGDYIVRLVPFGLGFWYEHFWTKRKITINRKTVLNEKRSSAEEYLQQFLRFQDTEPQTGDNAYDLYLRKIFKEIVVTTSVNKKRIIIELEGDDSALMLNSLIIYPKTKQKEGEEFVNQLYTVQKDEFDSLCRYLRPEIKPSTFPYSAQEKQRGFYTAITSNDKVVRNHEVRKSNDDQISLKAGRGQRPYQIFMVRNLQDDTRLTAIIGELKNAQGERIPLTKQVLRYGVQQYQSHTYNHETYELAPRFLRPFEEKGVLIPKDESVMLWYQLDLGHNIKPGLYEGELLLQMHGKQEVLPVKLEVLDFDLPPLDTAIGFFGLNPVEFDYYPGKNVEQRKKLFQKSSLLSLHQRGFTTWSTLPHISLEKGSNGKWQLETSAVDTLMHLAREIGFNQKIFTYGSDPSWGFESNNTGLQSDAFHTLLSSLLKKKLQQPHWLPIVADFSDEAAGYSAKVERDTQRGEILKKYYPYLQRGIYSHPIKKKEYGYDLNFLATDLSLSSQTTAYRDLLKEKHIRWGLYNQASGLFENNRIAFGLDFFLQRKQGADHLLGWHLVLSQNYPYYDLDGRESDAMMLFPRKNGELDYAIKYEWAANGVEDYRLLRLLEDLSAKTNRKGFDTHSWVQSNYKEFTNDMDKFREKLYQKILSFR